jgi:hypothetical protein
VYLVWGPLGPGPLRRFVASYQRHCSGADHDLVVLYNGVESTQRPALDAELQGVDFRLIELKAPVLDLAAYAHAARSLQYERLCFLNSYSVVLEPEWLAKLDDALNLPRVGLVGATGSWVSRRSSRLNSWCLPSSYWRLLPRGRFRDFPALECALDVERNGSEWSCKDEEPMATPNRPALRWYLRHALRGLASAPGELRDFGPFPNRHLRTNAFMTRRLTFEGMRVGTIKSKADTYALESGHNSLTRQVEQHDLRVLVVDKDGIEYESGQWPLSETLWQGEQEKLLIGDNQTRLYEGATLEGRKLLSAMAWGREARPELRRQALTIAQGESWSPRRGR